MRVRLSTACLFLAGFAAATLLVCAAAVTFCPRPGRAQPAAPAPRTDAPGPKPPARVPPPAVEEEDPRVTFRVAENTFRYQDYERAVELLRSLLHPTVRLVEADELRAREYLGASHWFLQHFDAAEEEFTVLLTREPEYELDAFYYPAALITFFEGVREKLVRLKVIVPDGDGPDEPPPAPSVVQERVVRERSLLVAFLPFGIGQFQNGDTTKGVVFLTVETLALATNIASYFVIDALREESGFIASQNIDRAEAFEIVLYTSLGVFAAVAVGGIVDALVNFEPRVETIRTLEPPPLEEPETTLRFLPSAGGDRFGLDMELRF